MVVSVLTLVAEAYERCPSNPILFFVYVIGIFNMTVVHIRREHCRVGKEGGKKQKKEDTIDDATRVGVTMRRVVDGTAPELSRLSEKS